MSTFCELWRDEVRVHMLAKGFMLIKDAKLLDPTSSFDFTTIFL